MEKGHAHRVQFELQLPLRITPGLQEAVHKDRGDFVGGTAIGEMLASDGAIHFDGVIDWPR